jgi:hypothetical protein
MPPWHANRNTLLPSTLLGKIEKKPCLKDDLRGGKAPYSMFLSPFVLFWFFGLECFFFLFHLLFLCPFVDFLIQTITLFFSFKKVVMLILE